MFLLCNFALLKQVKVGKFLFRDVKLLMTYTRTKLFNETLCLYIARYPFRNLQLCQKNDMNYRVLCLQISIVISY